MLNSIPLDVYLSILSEATAEDGPYKYEHDEAEARVLNGAFAEMTKGIVAFVTAAEPIIGYEAVRDMLEDVVHTFPASKEPADPFEAIQAALLKAMEIPEELWNEDAPKEN